MKGSGKLKKVSHISARLCSRRPLRPSQVPTQAIASRSRPQPTMMRKAKNGIATGGRSARGKSSKPTSFELKLMLPMTLPSTGTESE